MSDLPLIKWHPKKGRSSKNIIVNRNDLIEACYLWGFVSNSITDVRKSYINLLEFNENISYSKDYEVLDTTTRSEISFNLGMIFSIFFTKKIFGKVDIFDVNILEKYGLIKIDDSVATKRRPDFLFFLPNVNKPFFIEAKCYTNKEADYDDWREQINSIAENFSTINSDIVYKKVQGYITYFRFDSKTNKFIAEVIDPEINIELKYSVSELISLYYANLNKEIRKMNNYEKVIIDNEQYFGLNIDDTYIGVNENKTHMKRMHINEYDLYSEIEKTTFNLFNKYNHLLEIHKTISQKIEILSDIKENNLTEENFQIILRNNREVIKSLKEISTISFNSDELNYDILDLYEMIIISIEKYLDELHKFYRDLYNFDNTKMDYIKKIYSSQVTINRYLNNIKKYYDLIHHMYQQINSRLYGYVGDHQNRKNYILID